MAAPELWPLAAQLVGGLALFLFGLDQMTGALKAVAGDRLRLLLARLTTHRITAVATGALVTAVIQSSSVTTVLLVSFISSGVMSFPQSVGVIIGANIGTTVTAQIVAFQVTRLAFLMVAVGFALSAVSGRESLRQHGTGILALGLVFLGMTAMADAMAPLRDYPPALTWLARMEHPALGILAGAAFTALVQSSSATSGIVIAMASQGLITLSAGIALIFGSNLGTCVTAMIAAIGRPREAVRAAVVHVLFNVFGVVLWMAFIPEIAGLVAGLSPQAGELRGVARLAAETPRQIANAHTLFNVANAILVLPFTPLLARAAERLVPDRPIEIEEAIRARHLDPALLGTPSLALDGARRELREIGERVHAMLLAVLPAMLTGSPAALREVERMDEDVDRLYEQTIAYLGRISEQSLSVAETAELMQLMEVANALEGIGDLIETNLVREGHARLASDIRISEATRKLIEKLHGHVAMALGEAVAALGERDSARARRVVEMKPAVSRLAEEATRHQVRRLVASEAKRLPTYAIETDMLENLRRAFYFAKRIAKTVLAREGEQAVS